MRTVFWPAMLLTAVVGVATAAVAAPVDASVISGVRQVETGAYQLGSQAFTAPPSIGYQGRNELGAAVYYPSDVDRGRHPLIMIEHGQWLTCADAAAQRRLDAAREALTHTSDPAGQDRLNAIIDDAEALLLRWPCRAGTPQIPSYLGYGYLAEALAHAGFVVVSIGTNGINATSFGQADTVYQTRAALLDAHLAMWRDLDAGKGPLLAALGMRFIGHLDLAHVGTIGHSMGGGGVMQQIADGQHDQWPTGVRIAATFALAPTATWDDISVTTVPFAEMWGTCDVVNSGQYFDTNRERNREPIFRYTLTGGNHDFYNTQWSPSSGQVGADDDARPGSSPGFCASQFPAGDSSGPSDQHAMTETRQHALTTLYATAFFQRFLLGRADLDPLLRQPAGADVAVQADLP